MKEIDPLQSLDFEWYKEHLIELYEKYGDSYVAIKNQTVLGAYPTFSESIEETLKTELIGTFIIQKCGPDESAYTSYIAPIIFL